MTPRSAVTPRAPGRTSHGSALRLPGAETLLAPGAAPDSDMPPEAREAPLGGTPASLMREATQ